MVGVNAVLDDALVSVVRAAFYSGAVGYALVDEFVRDHYGHYGGHALFPLCKDGVKGLGLGQGPGEAVQQEAVISFDGVEDVLYHTLYNRVRYKRACGYEALGLEAKLSAGGDFRAEELSGGDVLEIVFFRDGS